MGKSVFEMNREELQEYNENKLERFKELFQTTNLPVDEIYERIGVSKGDASYRYIAGSRKRLRLSAKNRPVRTVIEPENRNISLCLKCTECEEYEYLRFNKKGDMNCFLYCKMNKEYVEWSNWYVQKDGYAYSTKPIVNGKKQFFHTLFKKDKNMVIDHKNGDRTDNRLKNLREVSSSENSQNIHLLWKDKRIVSKFPGVYWNRKRECWVSQARKFGKNNPNSEVIRKEGFKTEYEAYDFYIKALHEMGREVNTQTDAYKDYLKWKSKKQQATLNKFI